MESFINRLKEIDNGRYSKIVDAIGVKEICEDCGYFNYKAKDKYRCCVDCIGCLLKDNAKSYLLYKLGHITSDEHLINCGIKKNSDDETKGN